MAGDIKLVAFDLDGTLTQHKSPMDEKCRQVLERLSRSYRLVMVCAGKCERVYRQMEGFPIDIIGSYGMQVSSVLNSEFTLIEDNIVAPDKESVIQRIEFLRKELGFNEYAGDSVEFHSSGVVTFPILGTTAPLNRKLSFDPDRIIRRACLSRVREVFKDYTVFVGGSSSFDLAPPPYSKLYALDKYLSQKGLTRENTVYFGDDYGPGGNDCDIYLSDIEFIPIDDYRAFPEAAEKYLKEGEIWSTP